MRDFSAFPTSIVLALIGVLSLGGPAGAAKPLLDREWIMFESTHFTLVSAIDADFVRDLALELQVIDALAGRRAATETPAERAHTYVVLLPNRDFERLAQSKTYVSSFFASGDRNFVLSRASVRQEIDKYVRRAYARAAMQSLAQPALPAWLQEGYAAYLEGMRIEGGSLEFAIINEARFNSLGFNTWLAMDWIVDSATMSRLDGREWHLAAAQSWMLVHYLIHNDDADQSLLQWLNTYALLRSTGMDEIASFASMVDAEPADFRKELLAYFRRCCKNYAVPLDRILPDSGAKFSVPDRARVEAIMAGAAKAAKIDTDSSSPAADKTAGEGEELEALLAAFEANPSQFEYGWNLARAYKDAGDTNMAKLYARYLYVLNPGHEALAELARLEQSLESETDVR